VLRKLIAQWPVRSRCGSLPDEEESVTLHSPYGLEIVEPCAHCGERGGRLFCNLADDTLRGLDRIKFATTYPRGSLLFVEGQSPRGVYILCGGRVKLSTSSSDAKVIITQIAEHGELLGLSAALSGEPHEVTAETLDPCQVNFIRREDFLRFLSANGDACLKVAQQLSDNYRNAFDQVRLLGLSNSAAGKFARFLLEHSTRAGRQTGRGRSSKLTLTHEEIGQLIGASRETVTRLFSEFKSERIIQVKGATLLVNDEPALEALATA
jgi:CRP/FNR family transcriptional regulator